MLSDNYISPRVNVIDASHGTLGTGRRCSGRGHLGMAVHYGSLRGSRVVP